MQVSGLRENQVSQVRGYADQKLRVPANPLDPSNRRISLIVQYLTPDAPPVPAGKPGSPAPGADGTAPSKESAGTRLPAEKAGASLTPATEGSRAASAGEKEGGAGSAEGTKTAVSIPKAAAVKPATGVVARFWQKIHPAGRNRK
jgi:chemotaxis protein MotB